MSIKKINDIAKRKCGNVENWEPYYWKHIKNGILVKGCLTKKEFNGNNESRIVFFIKEMNMTTVVTREEQEND